MTYHSEKQVFDKPEKEDYHLQHPKLGQEQNQPQREHHQLYPSPERNPQQQSYQSKQQLTNHQQLQSRLGSHRLQQKSYDEQKNSLKPFHQPQSQQIDAKESSSLVSSFSSLDTISITEESRSRTTSENDKYFMLNEERQRYEKLYQLYLANVDSDSNIGAKYFNNFTKSALDDSIIQKIWYMVTDDKRAIKLSKVQFTIAFHLVTCLTEKKLPLPAILPASLLKYKENEVINREKSFPVMGPTKLGKLGRNISKRKTELGEMKACKNMIQKEEPFSVIDPTKLGKIGRNISKMKTELGEMKAYKKKYIASHSELTETKKNLKNLENNYIEMEKKFKAMELELAQAKEKIRKDSQKQKSNEASMSVLKLELEKLKDKTEGNYESLEKELIQKSEKLRKVETNLLEEKKRTKNIESELVETKQELHEASRKVESIEACMSVMKIEFVKMKSLKGKYTSVESELIQTKEKLRKAETTLSIIYQETCATPRSSFEQNQIC